MDTGYCRGSVQQRFIQNAADNTQPQINVIDGVTQDKTLSVRQMNMKKIYTLVCVLMFSAGVFAADTDTTLKMEESNSAAVTLLLEQAEELGLIIQDVDGSQDEYITFTVSGGPTVKIQWLEMGRNTETEKADLKNRLNKLKAIIQQDKLNNVDSVDCTDTIAEQTPSEVPSKAGP